MKKIRESGPQGGPGLIVAAPSSSSGKTVFTLGLLRHLSDNGIAVASAKGGPDYIDPAFHAAATGRACINLDPWAMRPALLLAAAEALAADASLVVCEGMMGLFDGAVGERGSTADLSERTGWPVILVIDAGAQGASAAAVLGGFAKHRPGFRPAGVVFNRVGSERHKAILENAARAAEPDIPILGFVPPDPALKVPDRHLGLVQAVEHENLELFLDSASRMIGEHIDIDGLAQLAAPLHRTDANALPANPLKPIGQRIAIAEDEAFSFRYALTIDGWRRQGAEISFFSPLDDMPPPADADAVYLPGGYPELHGYRLASANRFMDGLRQAAAGGAVVFGECGGYMVLGRGLVDADGARHVMAGLLPLETSFAERQMHLGYREASLDTAAALGSGSVLGDPGERFCGHEYHYATIVKEGPGAPLFQCRDAAGNGLGLAGIADGRVMGSFVHLIDRMGDDGDDG